MKKEELNREIMYMLAHTNISSKDIGYLKGGPHKILPLFVFVGVTLVISYMFYDHNIVWCTVLFGCLNIAAITNLLMYAPDGPIFAGLYAMCGSVWLILFLEVSKTYKNSGNVDVGSDMLMGSGLGMIIYVIIVIWFYGDE